MKLIYGLLSTAMLLAISSSCSDDYNPSEGSSGKINPLLELDAEAITSRSQTQSRDAAAISVNDLKLRLTSADGSFAKEWSSISEFDNNELYKVGKYTLEATYGTIEEEGFEKPYYYGSTEVIVKENKVTQASLSAKLANSMVSIATTEAFQSYFSSYSFQARSKGGEYINFTSTESRPAYLRPGEVTVTADVTKPNGQTASLEAAVFVAEPKHHYTITIDVNNGEAGSAQLVITYDDLLDKEDVIIDLSDDIMSYHAPVVVAQGFEVGTTISVREGEKSDATPSFFINAEAGISSVVLTTQSSSLIEQGWYGEIDLAAATPAQQSKLKSLGLDVKGLFGNIDRMAQIDFTNVIPFIKYLESNTNISTFTIVAKDKYNRLSEPISLTILIDPILLKIEADVTPEVGTSKMSLIVNYNGADLANEVKIQYKNIRGTWDNTSITNVTKLSEERYNVEIDGIPANDATVTLRAVVPTKQSNELTFKKTGFTISATANDSFATRARLVPSYLDDETKDGASSAVYSVSEDGSSFTTVSHNMESDGSVWITGLPSGKNLTVKATIGSKTAKTQITTEVAAQIPDSDMNDNWWRAKGGNNWDFYYAYAEGTPQVWDTMNEETTSETGVGAAYVTTSGTKPTTGVNGQCAVIRTVGWGSGNTAGGSLSIVYNTSAGQLYLGRFNGVGQTPNYGYAFSSRPSSIKFNTKYAAYKSEDFGSAEIQVLDASGNVIASNSTTIGTDRSDWGEITLPLSYPANAAKAAKIIVVFKSTAHNNGASRDFLKLPAFAANSKTESVGGQLYIDDIMLNY